MTVKCQICRLLCIRFSLHPLRCNCVKSLNSTLRSVVRVQCAKACAHLYFVRVLNAKLVRKTGYREVDIYMNDGLIYAFSRIAGKVNWHNALKEPLLLSQHNFKQTVFAVNHSIWHHVHAPKGINTCLKSCKESSLKNYLDNIFYSDMQSINDNWHDTLKEPVLFCQNNFKHKNCATDSSFWHSCAGVKKCDNRVT